MEKLWKRYGHYCVIHAMDSITSVEKSTFYNERLPVKYAMVNDSQGCYNHQMQS